MIEYGILFGISTYNSYLVFTKREKMDVSISHVGNSKSIICCGYTGTIELKEIAGLWQRVISHHKFNDGFTHLLFDCREAEFAFSLEECHGIEDFFAPYSDVLIDKKIAIIALSSLNTAFAIYFEYKLKFGFGFNIKVFCTKEAAIEWIEI